MQSVRPGSWARSVATVLGAVLSLSVGGSSLAQPDAAPAPIEIRVVVITTWEVFGGDRDLRGEMYDWHVKWPMKTELPFPVGVHPLLYDPQRHVLTLLTGMATARAAISITALGMDPRFDLTHAYWVLAGTAGVNPAVASAGSVAWERYVVDGDLEQEIDARDIPQGWSTGILPNDRLIPFAEPPPPANNPDGDMAFALNPTLTDWAYRRTKAIALPDDARLAKARAPYAGPGAAPPFVLEGDGLMSARFWYGEHLDAWARRWVPYWTGGKGVFAMSAEEDTGVMEALSFLARGGKVRLDRVLMLRGASDYVVAAPGVTAAQQIAKQAREGLPANQQALDNLYAVASPVVRALADDWAQTRDHVPGGP